MARVEYKGKVYTGTWRECLRPVIQDVLGEHGNRVTQDEALLDAYPFPMPSRGGPSHMYKVWRDEIAKLRGDKPRRNPSSNPTHESYRCENTLSLFGE